MFRIMKKYSALSQDQKELMDYAIYNEELKSTSFVLKGIKHKAYLWLNKDVEYLIVMDLLKTIKPKKYFIPEDYEFSFLDVNY